MNSDNLCGQVHDYMDLDLTPSQTEQFETHLDECLACQAELRSLQEMGAVLKSAWQNVDVQPPMMHMPAPMPKAKFHLTRVLLTTVAALLIMVGVVVVVQRSSDSLARIKTDSDSDSAFVSRRPMVESDTEIRSLAGYQSSWASGTFGENTQSYMISTNPEFTVFHLTPTNAVQSN